MVRAGLENKDMNRHFLKISVVMVISFVLLYYSAAWAVLRCSHDDSEQEVVELSADPVHPSLECAGPDYHTESVAGASLPSQLDRLMSKVARHVNDLLTLRIGSGDAAGDVWLRTVFETHRARAFHIELPSYLVLSILRI